MSLSEFAPSLRQESKVISSISEIQPPLGGIAISGFNGSGESRSLFSNGEYSNRAKVNGFDNTLELTQRTSHLISLDRSGELQVKKQTYAVVLDTLSAHLEHEIALNKIGKEPTLRDFVLVIDNGNDFVMKDNMNFIGFEYNGDNKRYPSNAVFATSPPESNGQLSIDGNLSIPLKEIHHIKYAMPVEKQ